MIFKDKKRSEKQVLPTSESKSRPITLKLDSAAALQSPVRQILGPKNLLPVR